MKTKNILGSLTGSILLTIVTSAVYFPASARDPFTKEELKAQEKKLLAVLEEGYNIWHGSKVWEQFQPDAWIAAVLFGNESQIFEMRQLPVIEAVNTLLIQLGNCIDSLKISHGFSLANALLFYPSLSNRTPLPLQSCLVIKDPPSFICLNV
jgi:hypothetical protein